MIGSKDMVMKCRGFVNMCILSSDETSSVVYTTKIIEIVHVHVHVSVSVAELAGGGSVIKGAAPSSSHVYRASTQHKIL